MSLSNHAVSVALGRAGENAALKALDGILVDWGPVTGRFSAMVTPDDLAIVSNVHVVGTLGDLVVMVRGDQWELPGGTVEPGESIEDCIERELLEESGAVPTSFDIAGVFTCRSDADTPYRPHIPHPRFNILLGFCSISHVVAPTGWGSHERHEEVSLAQPAHCVSRLLSVDSTKSMGMVCAAVLGL